eukprot:337752_1
MVSCLWIILPLIFIFFRDSNSQLPILSNVTCGDIIIDSIGSFESHYYQLTLNDSHNVNFDDCESNRDINIIILDEINNDISNTYCSGGDNCGECNNFISG